MPIRWRPEAGFLLALASGRLFARRRGGDRVTLRRRRSREVYRVYTEDEYLNGAGLEPATIGEWPAAVEPADACLVAAEPRRGLVRERRLRRAAGAAMLAGAVGTVGGVLAINSSRTHRGTGRRPGSLVAATHTSRIVRSSSPSWPVGAHRSEAMRSRFAQTVGWRGVADIHFRAGRPGGSDTHPPERVRRGARQALPAGGRVQRGAGAEVVVDYAPATSTDQASADGAAKGSTTTGSTGAETVRAGTGHVEFGFER
jgi:hypothetical protein